MERPADPDFDSADDATPFISVRGVSKAFADRPILRDVHLDIRRGETIALIGPSGGGKSTLLRCINGLVGFDAGEIQVAEHRVAPRRNGARQPAVHDVRRLLGMVFQDFQLFSHLTALDNVALGPIEVLGLARDEARARGRQLLDRVGLAARTDHFPHQLSGGQKQRVAIARALAMAPRGLLCDEITSALDPEVKREVLAVLEDLRRDGLTLVIVTHEIGFARRAADRVAFLADGGVAEVGHAAEVFAAPRSDRLRTFLSQIFGD